MLIAPFNAYTAFRPFNVLLTAVNTRCYKAAAVLFMHLTKYSLRTVSGDDARGVRQRFHGSSYIFKKRRYYDLSHVRHSANSSADFALQRCTRPNLSFFFFGSHTLTHNLVPRCTYEPATPVN